MKNICSIPLNMLCCWNGSVFIQFNESITYRLLDFGVKNWLKDMVYETDSKYNMEWIKLKLKVKALLFKPVSHFECRRSINFRDQLAKKLLNSCSNLQISTPNHHPSILTTCNRQHFCFVLFKKAFQKQSASSISKSERACCVDGEKMQLPAALSKKAALTNNA